MGDYSAGDLSKLFQGSGTTVSQSASGLFSPKRPSQKSKQATESVKKVKKKKKTESPEQVNVKEKLTTVEQNSKPEVAAIEKEKSGHKKKNKKKNKEAKEEKVDGFSPPPGIMHESLVADKEKQSEKQKTKKRKINDVDSDGEEIEAKKSKPDKEQTRMRRDRVKKENEKRTIFIGNLPISMKKKSLLKMFKEFGEIENVRYRCLPTNDPAVPKRVMAIKEDFHPSRNNCVAYICYKEEEQAQKALSKNGEEIEGLHIRVDIAGKVEKSDMKTSVFVGNLPYDLEEEQLREHFEDCGKIENVRIIRDRKTSIGKGFGYVKFAEKDSVSFATKLSGSVLKKRQIRVSGCVAKPKKAGKDGKEKRPKKKLAKKSQDGEDFPTEKKIFGGRKKFQEGKKKDHFKSPNKPTINFKSPKDSVPSQEKQNGTTKHIHFGDDASTDDKKKVNTFRKSFKKLKDKKRKKSVTPSNVKKNPFHKKFAKKDSKKPNAKKKRF